MGKVVLNKWYYDEDSEQRFEVIDCKDEYIIVQGLDGSITEYSIDEWDTLVLEAIPAPNRWGLSWDNDHSLDEGDDRYEIEKRSHRLKKEEHHLIEDMDDLSFSDDLSDSQDFDCR